jgi:sucrose phosphorylase
MRNQVQLIAYADRLGGSLPGLLDVLHGPLAGLFGGIHVLPFYRPYDGADAGFDPADHTAVDPRLGTWADLRRLGASLDTVVDLIVNHVSADAPQFRDFVDRGDASPWAGMFLTFGRVFQDGATEQDQLRIYRPRPGLPFTPVIVQRRSRRLMWTTFTSRQIDLDVGQPVTRGYLLGVLERLAEHGVATVRLDAVGYAVKTAGTSCFMTADTLVFVAELSQQARQVGVEVLAELHSHYRHQIDMSRHVDWVLGLVRRHRDDDGRRLMRLQLTPAGARRRAALGAAHLEELSRLASLATAAAVGLDAAAGAEPHRPRLAPSASEGARSRPTGSTGWARLPPAGHPWRAPGDRPPRTRRPWR